MSYVVEGLAGMSSVDIKAWAFLQTHPGNTANDRITEAGVIIAWLMEGRHQDETRSFPEILRSSQDKKQSSFLAPDSSVSSSVSAVGESAAEVMTPSRTEQDGTNTGDQPEKSA